MSIYILQADYWGTSLHTLCSFLRSRHVRVQWLLTSPLTRQESGKGRYDGISYLSSQYHLISPTTLAIHLQYHYATSRVATCSLLNGFNVLDLKYRSIFTNPKSFTISCVFGSPLVPVCRSVLPASKAPTPYKPPPRSLFTVFSPPPRSLSCHFNLSLPHAHDTL